MLQHASTRTQEGGPDGTRSCPDTREHTKNLKASRTVPDPLCACRPAILSCSLSPSLSLLHSASLSVMTRARTHARTYTPAHIHTQDGRTCVPAPVSAPLLEYSPVLRVVRNHVGDGSVGGEPEHCQEGAVEGAELVRGFVVEDGHPHDGDCARVGTFMANALYIHTYIQTYIHTYIHIYMKTDTPTMAAVRA
jgi:hypothetical protein